MEFSLIEAIRRRATAQPGVLLGIGDDAAWLAAPPGEGWLVTTDVLMDGVDFEVGVQSPARIGRKALAVNLSDIAAMGGKAVAAVVGLVLPRQGGRDLAAGLYDGIQPLADAYSVAIAGGDTNSWPGPLVISVTVLGTPLVPGKVWRRSGARPGDRIVVTGRFGGSIRGHHLDFEPRLNAAAKLAAGYEIQAAIDVSDGLAADLGHILDESRVGAIVDVDCVPIAEAAHAAAHDDGRAPLLHALADGEDFELVLALAPAEAARLIADQPLEVACTDIGEFTVADGLWQRRGELVTPLAAAGYEHRLE